MNQPTGYPKSFWILTRAEVVVEDGREVINHDKEHALIGGTFDSHVAEKMASVLKEHQGLSTMIRSDVNPLPTAVLNAIPEQNASDVDNILNMVNV